MLHHATGKGTNHIDMDVAKTFIWEKKLHQRRFLMALDFGKLTRMALANPSGDINSHPRPDESV